MSKKKAAAVAVSPLLVQIVAAGDAGMWGPKGADLDALVKSGFVQTGPDGDNNTVAVKATPAGIEAAKNAPVASTSAPVAKPSFAIVANVPIPESNRGGNKGKSIYPFDALEVGDSFFIPASTEHPHPAKSLASTASSATRRFNEPVMENGVQAMETVTIKAKAAKGTEGTPDFVSARPASTVQRPKMVHTRIFVMRPIADGAPWGQPGVSGAGCFRTK